MKDATGNNGLRRSMSIRVADTPDGVVLLDVKRGLCFITNSVGAIIWRYVERGCSPSQIVEHLVAAFSISPEQARGDVQEFLDDLKRRQLVYELGAAANSTSGHRKFAGLFARFLPGLFRSRTTQDPE